MRIITIRLAREFAGDTVVLRIDQREVYRRENLTTKLLTGLADETEIEVSEDAVLIEAEMPARRVRLVQEISRGGDTAFELRFLDDALQLVEQDATAGYL